MKKLIREFFFLRKGERRAIYVVLFLLTLSAVFRIYFSCKPLPELQPDAIFLQYMGEIRRQIDSAMKAEQEKYASWNKGKGDRGKVMEGAKNAGEGPLAPRSFDPNTVTYNALLSMNLSAYVSKNIINYRKAGGSFREPADLSKIYGLEQADYEALLPFIVIRSSEAPVHGEEDVPDSAGHLFCRDKQTRTWRDTLLQLELNRADSADLIALPGIGPWFAGRIIHYRELLGGFVDPQQLLEVYGMDTARFMGIASFLTADTTFIDRIDLNHSTFQEIISHPYINREETYAIFRYRDFQDSIRRPENILEDQIIDHDRFMRMAPYLTVQRRNE